MYCFGDDWLESHVDLTLSTNLSALCKARSKSIRSVVVFKSIIVM